VPTRLGSASLVKGYNKRNPPAVIEAKMMRGLQNYTIM
jgi:hypothetical protein